ncbi:MAG: hypothetical protein ACKVPJ_09945 [Chitinophagales bacterium]
MKNIIISIMLLWPFGKYILTGHTNTGEIVQLRFIKKPECYLNETFYMDTKNGKDFFYVNYPTEHYLIFDYYSLKNTKNEKETPVNDRSSDDLADDSMQPH